MKGLIAFTKCLDLATISGKNGKKWINIMIDEEYLQIYTNFHLIVFR